MPLLVWGAWQDPYPVDLVAELAKRSRKWSASRTTVIRFMPTMT